MPFQISSAGTASKMIPKSSKLEFLENFSAINFALWEAEGNTSVLLIRGNIVDLPLLRTLQ